MEYLGEEDERERDLLTAVINFSFHQGWINENERLQITSKSTAQDMNMAIYKSVTYLRSDEVASKLLCAMRCIKEPNISQNSVVNLNELKSTIMSKLLEEQLVTEDEVIAFERKLKNQDSRFARVRSAEFCPCPSRRLFQQCRNPLQFPQVLSSVSQYLDIDDVINSRSASKEWSSIWKSMLPTFANIEFRSPESISKFFKDFSRSSAEILPFHSFKFSGMKDEIWWPISKLEKFFAKQGRYITKLKLEQMHVEYNWYSRPDCFDITPWISNSALTKEAETDCNTELSVSCAKKGNLAVDLNALDRITNLKLDGMQLNLQDGVRISPIKLNLSQVTFFKEGHRLTTLCVNDIIDFSTAKYISLECISADENLSLDMSGSLQFEELALTNITLRNLETCAWKIKKLVLYCMNFGESQMQVKEAIMKMCRILDISFLPPSVEKLCFEVDVCSIPFNPPVIVNNNVKFLELSFVDTDMLSDFTQNAHFPNLTHLHFINEDDSENNDYIIDEGWIPISVRFLALQKFKIGNITNSLDLDKLFLNPDGHFRIEELCSSNITTQELVLDFKHLELSVDCILNNLEQLNAGQNGVQRFYVGNLNWAVRLFEISPLRRLVDRKSNCYLFQNQRGTAIDEREFELRNNFHRTYAN